MKHYRILISLGACSMLLWACGQGQRPSAQHAMDGYAIPDSSTVPYEEARRLVANYAKRAGHVIRDGDTLPNTRTVFFPIGQLVALTTKLEQAGADGLRIYFAAYDSTYTEGRPHVPPREYWGYNTVLLVGTRDSTVNGEVMHRDFFADTGGTILNFGGICPPPPCCGPRGAILLQRQPQE